MVRVRLVLKNLIFLTIGAFIAATGLEEFLVPNNIIDGGVVGISIMASYVTKLPLGMFLICLNIPFLIYGYKQLGRGFLVYSLYAVVMLAIFVTLLHKSPNATDDLFLACIFGGIIVGLGVGLILRNNGSLDGTEIVAMSIGKNIPFSVGEIIMFINLFILGSAAFIFGIEKAMYSIATYFIISKTIDVVLEGFEESKSVTIISSLPEKIADIILHELKRGVTFIEGEGGYSREYKKIIYCIVTRLEISKLRQLVLETDPKAFLAIANVHEVEGGRVKLKR
ncbi:MAG: YitT family protein [Candidatus Gastranaerophilales bacterium]|nr:YitT family protein [Candidatus Gastranaerophilales bacterium]